MRDRRDFRGPLPKGPSQKRMRMHVYEICAKDTICVYDNSNHDNNNNNHHDNNVKLEGPSYWGPPNRSHEGRSPGGGSRLRRNKLHVHSNTILEHPRESTPWERPWLTRHHAAAHGATHPGTGLRRARCMPSGYLWPRPTLCTVPSIRKPSHFRVCTSGIYPTDLGIPPLNIKNPLE